MLTREKMVKLLLSWLKGQEHSYEKIIISGSLIVLAIIQPENVQKYLKLLQPTFSLCWK